MGLSDTGNSTMQGRIVQVSLSRGGIPKLSTPEAYCGPLGLEGDEHAHPRFHGGPKKALLLVSGEDLENLTAEGFALFPGALGENLTVEGLDFRQLRPGQRFRAGDSIIELTTVRVPCETLNVYNDGRELAIQKAVYDSRVKAGDATSERWARAGFYAAVLNPGWIRTGDPIQFLEQVT